MMKFTAAGDAIIQRRIPTGYEGYQAISDFLNKGDVRFFNLETTLHREGECYGNQFSGGTYIRSDPEVLQDLIDMGFNITSFNNNHVLDFALDGMLKTLDYVEKSGIVHAGVGKNLASASAPRYLDTPDGRVALIAVNTTFHPSAMAGVQNERIMGRPGINGLRISEKLEVTAEELRFIRQLAERLNINAERQIIRKEGYLPPMSDNVAEFGTDTIFTLGECTKRTLCPNTEDLQRIEKAIWEAKLQADYIMVSIHSHQIDGDAKESVPAFLQEVSHAVIDMGADAVIGHGPHLLRPIEVYQDKPIFYSLGDFILQLYSIPFAPADFFQKHGVDPNATVHELLRKRSKDFTVGLMEDPRMMEAVIPYWETKDRKLTSLQLLPIELMRGDCKKGERGLPRPAQNLAFMDHLAEISRPFGVEMKPDANGIVVCNW